MGAERIIKCWFAERRSTISWKRVNPFERGQMQIQHTDGLCNGRGKEEDQIPLYPLLELSEALGCALFNCKFIVKSPTQKRQSVLNPLQRL